MRYFDLTKEEFEQAIYPAVAGPAPETKHEERLVTQALEVLEGAGSLTPMSLLEMRAENAIPLCTMRGFRQAFAMEDAVHEAMIRQVDRYTPKLPAGFARRVREIADRLGNAPTTPPVQEAAETYEPTP